MGAIDALKQVDFFRNLSDIDLNRVAEFFYEVRFTKDQIIFREGDPGDIFFILADGLVEITKRIDGEATTEAELKLFGPYEYFGEMAVMDDSPRSATARAHSDVVLHAISKEDLLHVAIEFPTTIYHMLRTISNRLRYTNDQFATVMGRLLRKNKMEAIGSAASRIVHDLKTPLTVILLTAQLLEARFPGAEKLVNKIVNQSYLVDDMVREILDYAKGGQISLDLRPNEMGAVFSEINENLALLASDHNVRLAYRNDLSEKVCFDTKRIKRTIANIVKNAIEAMKDGGEILIECDRCGEQICLRVSDTGPGIPEDIIDTIFEPFVSKGKAEGTGLGLAICQKVVTDHGGTIIASNWERGARFEIFLPYRRG
jgi:signal transduction histidine kinase